MKKLLYLFIALLLAACQPKAKQATGTESFPSSKPNIIYILADDLGYADLSCYGQNKFQTPNIDKLASEGMLFTQHYSGSTVCAPSRSALLTGYHTGHTPVRGNFEIMPEGQWPQPDSVVTLPEMLKRAGYVTGAFGKWGLGYPGSEGDPVNQGFDRFYGYNCQRLAHHYYPHYIWDNFTKVVLEENNGQAEGIYGPELIHEKSLEFIREHRDTAFFLFYPSLIPHAELFAPEENIAKFRGKFEPEKSYAGVDEGPDFRKGAYGSQPESHAAFAGMVDLLDRQVGEIVDLVDSLGLSKNTIIVFSSDNGPHQEGGADPDYFNSNGPLKGYKRDLYEGGIRVPMLVRWPGTVAASSQQEHISAFWDIVPTFLEIAGLETRQSFDGISFLPALTQSGEQPKHEYLYWEFHEQGGRQAIRQGNWKAVQYEVFSGDRPMELYDLANDPGEETNLASHHPEKIAAMKSLMEKARTDSEVFRFQSKTIIK